VKTLEKAYILFINGFLADRSNGRTIGTVLRLSVICNVNYCG